MCGECPCVDLVCECLCGECRVWGVPCVESSVCEEFRVCGEVPCVVSAVCGECRVYVESSVCGV